MGEAGIGAAQFRRKPWGVRGESFDVQFVDDGFAPWHMRVGWFSHMLVDVAVVNGHGNRHVSQRVHGAHRSERRTGDLAVFDLAFVGEGAGSSSILPSMPLAYGSSSSLYGLKLTP